MTRNRLIRELRVGDADLYAVAFSPDGAMLATAGEDGVATIITMEGRTVARRADHRELVRSVEWSPDGANLASVAQGGALCIWNVRTEQLEHRVNLNKMLRCARWSPDGSLIVVGAFDANAPVVIDTATGGVVRHLVGHRAEARMAAWSPDGSRITSGSEDKTVRVWDAHTGLSLLCLEADGPLLSVGWSPDGSKIAAGTRGGQVHIWDPVTGTRLLTTSLNTTTGYLSCYALSWSHDSRLVAGDNGSITHVLDAATGREVAQLTGTLGIDFSPDGVTAAAGCDRGIVCIYDVSDLVGHRAPIRRPTHPISAYVARQAATVGRQAGTHRNAAVPWVPRLQEASGPCLGVLNGTPDRGTYVGVAVHPDGRSVITGHSNGDICRWNLVSGQSMWEIHRTNPRESNEIERIAISPDGSLMASDSGSGTIQFWDTTTGQRLHTGVGQDSIYRIVWSADGHRLATTDTSETDSVIRVWNTDSGTLVFTCHADEKSQGLGWSRDRCYLASGDNSGTISLWDAATGALRARWTPLERPNAIWTLSWSPDSRHLAIASDAGEIVLLRIADGEVVSRMKHAGGALAIDWSPDGQFIASGALGAGHVFIWEPFAGKEIDRFPVQESCFQCAWSRDGAFLVSCQYGGEARFWDTRHLFAAGQVIAALPSAPLRPRLTLLPAALSTLLRHDRAAPLSMLRDLLDLTGVRLTISEAARLTRYPGAPPTTSGVKADDEQDRGDSVELDEERAWHRVWFGEYVHTVTAGLAQHSGVSPIASEAGQLAQRPGQSPIASDVASLALHPRARALRALDWPSASRVAMVLLLLRDYYDPAFALPSGVAPAEVEADLTAALAGPAILEDRPPMPIAALTQALDAVDDRVLTLLSALGPDACAADPGLPLTLLSRLPDIAPLAAPERRLLALHLGSGEGRTHSSGAGHERAGLSPVGDLRSLLPSQWALPEPIRAFRYHQGGLLYRARTGREPPRLRPTVVVLDVSPPCFGPIERILRPAAHALASALLAASEPAYCVAAGGDNRVRPLQHPLDLVELCAARTLDPVDTARTLTQAGTLARSLAGQGALEPIIVLFTQPWFGAEDRHVAAPPHLRALFVHYPDRPVEPAWRDRCERWELVAPGATAIVSDALARLMV